MEISAFQELIWNYYNDHARSMPWRTNTDPYYILVSEMMLQQTQVGRVIPKFEEFLRLFPTVHELAAAPQAEVLKAWSGLGYNRRAKFLHAAATEIVSQYDGRVPTTLTALTNLPGIGHNTACAIVTYAYNQPVTFVETNIRAVFLHHFFEGQVTVDDKQLLPYISNSLDTSNPREWYWALMDYGAHLKATHPNPSRRSKHHSKQSVFNGSVRQLRGKILKELTLKPMHLKTLIDQLEDERCITVLETLQKEGLITITDDTVHL